MSPSIRNLLGQLNLSGDDARLDAELLLAHCLDRTRTYLYSWPEKELPQEVVGCFSRLWSRREAGEPVAYLLGEREFWSLNLQVNKDTLIPRPETEILVEWALELPLPESARVSDWGTGSGAIALALASERPAWDVLALDVSPAALVVARSNAERLQLNNFRTATSNWAGELGDKRFDLVVSNPPYVADRDPHLAQGDLRFEPRLALSSGPDGLDALTEIAAVAPDHLARGAWLLLEHGYEQGPQVRSLLRDAGFEDVSTRLDLAGHERISGGCWRDQ